MAAPAYVGVIRRVAMADEKTRTPIQITLDESSPLWDRRDIAETILTTLSDGMLVIDNQGRIVLANPAAGRILGVSMDSMSTQGWAELFFSESLNMEFNQIIVTVIQQNIEYYNAQVPYTRPNGDLRQLTVTATVMTDPTISGKQEIQAVLVVFNDITDLVAAHQRENDLLNRSHRLTREKAEGLDRLARAVAHEIRNPITSIGGLTRRLLSNTPTDSKSLGYLERILESTQRLETVVREVRDYADLPAPRLRPLELCEWLDRQADSLQAETQAAGMNFIKHVETIDDQEVIVRADTEMLEYILQALVTNAIEAMRDNGLLRLGLKESKKIVVITVCDSGKGIDPADMPYLFDPFFSTKTNAVCMSLAMAKRMALEQHGDLTVQSQAGRGATFTLSLPLSDGKESASDMSVSARPPSLK